MEEIVDLYAAVQSFLTVLLVWAFYRSDNDTRYYEGKKSQIKAPPYGKLITRITMYGVFSVVFGSLLIGRAYFIPVVGEELSVHLTIFGMLMSIVGLAIFVISKVSLDSSYSPFFKSYVPKELVETGVYKHLRHPLYLGNLLIMIGAFFITGSAIVLGLTFVLYCYYIFAAACEERALSDALPAYPRYLKSTHCLLLPEPLMTRIRLTLDGLNSVSHANGPNKENSNNEFPKFKHFAARKPGANKKRHLKSVSS